MTLQQLRYVTAVAGTGTISHAVQQFYISQPSLTNAIRELEQEVRLALSKTERLQWRRSGSCGQGYH